MSTGNVDICGRKMEAARGAGEEEKRERMCAAGSRS